VLPASAVTLCQNAAESGWKFLQPRSVSDSSSGAGICTLAASAAISSIAASRICADSDSCVDAEIKRAMIDCSFLARTPRSPAVLAFRQRYFDPKPENQYSGKVKNEGSVVS
jgi:hypothetical protein